MAKQIGPVPSPGGPAHLLLPGGEQGDDAAHGGDATLEVDRAQHRLERGGEDRLARAPTREVLAAPETQPRAEVEGEGPAREVGARHQLGAVLREDADGGAGVTGEEVLGYDEGEDGIADESRS